MDDDGALSRDLHRSSTLRARALDAAMALVVARGPDGINLRDIAAELNTGAASLYYHFKNKDALLAEVAAEGFPTARGQGHPGLWTTKSGAPRSGPAAMRICSSCG